MIDIRWLWLFLDTPEADIERAQEFWTAATRTTASERRGDNGEFLTLRPKAGDAWLRMQRVGGPGGIHLDLDVDDPAAAAEDAVELGAQIVAEVLDEGFVVMRSPGGFVFCFTDTQDDWPDHPTRTPAQVRAGEPDLLDQICLDVPASLWDREGDFWSALTGWELAAGSRPEFADLAHPPNLPIQLLLQRLVEPNGMVRAHVDIAAVDASAAADRLVALGAHIREHHPLWIVLDDPVGRTFCVTRRHPETGTRTRPDGTAITV